MTLKEQMAKEASLFLNPDEFGEYMDVDGHLTLGVWDEKLETAPAYYGATMDVIGVNTIERLLFLLPNGADPLPMPLPAQELDIDGQTGTGQDSKPEGAIIKRNLYRNES